MGNKELNVKFIKVREPQICEFCKNPSKNLCICEDKVLCKNCYFKIKQKETNDKVSNPKMCISKKAGVICNICDQVVTTYQKFKSGKRICISCFNKLSESQIKQLQAEVYDVNNFKKYQRPYRIRFVQGGNP